MNVFEKLGGWTLGKKYYEGIITSIEVNPDNTVILGLDFGKIIFTFKYDETQQYWCNVDNEISNQALLNSSVLKLPFRKRTKNLLRAGEIQTVGELIKLTYGDLKKIRMFGKKSYNDVIKVLNEYGLELKDSNIKVW